MARHLKGSNWGAVALSATLALTLAPANSFAADEEPGTPPKGLQFGVRLGAKYTDNYLHSDTELVDSTVGIVGFEVGGNKQTGRLALSAYGDVEYQEPFENSLEADVVGRMAATADYALVPGTVNLVAAGLFTQVRPDLFRPVSVNNREDVLSYSVGPTINLGLGDALSARIDARYTASDYSLRPLDNETAGAEIIIGHDGVRENFIGLGAGYYDVQYKEKIDPTAVVYTRQRAFARYYVTGTRTTLRLDAGYERVEGDVGEESGPLVRASLSRTLSPSVQVYATYTSEFPISDNSLLGAPIREDESILTAAPRRTRFGTLGLSYTRPRTQADLSVMHSLEEGVLATEGERTWQEVRGTLTRNFTSNSLGTLYAGHSKEDLSGLSMGSLKATKTLYGGDFEMLFGRQLSVLAYVQYQDLDSNSALDRYDEFMAGVYVRYGRVDARAVESGATAPLGR